MPLVSGTKAAGFSIVRPLEYGEFGELYEAEHPRLPRHQILQLIPADVSADLDYRELFNQELDLAAQLWHPNIIGITDRGEFEEQLWISTDYIDGHDTATLLGRKYPNGMPPKMVIEIVSAVADALDYAHDCGVLHRYVNPGAILVSKSPSDRRRVTLTGFGVARPIGEVNNTLTRANLFIGTASFAAPEQLMDEAVDGRADQYALASSAFHLLTGSPPFAHFNPTVTISKHLNERPPRASEVRPDLIEFDAIFARALSQDPFDRFRRCRDFAKALESNGGTRAHASPASIVRDATDDPPAIAASLIAKPQLDDAALTEPATPAAPDTGNGDAVTTPVAPAVLPDVLPEVPDVTDVQIDDAAPWAEPTASGTPDDGAAAKRRRLLHAAALPGVIAVVVLAGIFGVRALRSASEPIDPPAIGDSTSAEPTTSPLPTTDTPAPSMMPPPPVRRTTPSQPVVTASATPTTTPTTTPPKTKPSPPVTTSASAAPQTAISQTTSTRSATSQTTKPPKNGLDTRPAVGMPCGPEQAGASATSNAGGPVTCVETPGGSAWEPPGG